MKKSLLLPTTILSGLAVLLAIAVSRGVDGSSELKFLMAVRPIHEVKAYQDVRFKDMAGIDFSARADVPATLNFNQATVWPAAWRSKAKHLLTGAMNPGLGIRKLHHDGLTGKGVAVAIIDQPLYEDHPEFAGKIAAYYDTGCSSKSSMHGPSVASLLVGTNCGTAPEACLYLYAGHDSEPVGLKSPVGRTSGTMSQRQLRNKHPWEGSRRQDYRHDEQEPNRRPRPVGQGSNGF